MALINVKNNDYLWEESFNYFSSKGQAHVALWPRSYFDKGPRPDFSHWGWRLTDLPLLWGGDYIEVRTLVSPVILIFPLFQGRFRTEYHGWSLDSNYQLLTLQVIATTKHKPTRFYSDLC